MRTQKFEIEITDVTGQFPVSSERLQNMLEENLPFSHWCQVKEVIE